MHLRSSLLAASTLVLLGACTSRGGPTPPTDAGQGADARTGIDAQTGVDASVPPIDASDEMDGGPADVRPDAGPDKPDSGTPDGGPPDSGARPDSGTTPIDAGRDSGLDAPPETCPEADLGSALGDALRTGSTVGASDDGARSCGYSSGAPDRTFSWTAPAAGTYVVDTSGSSYDTLVDVLAGTCAGAALGCDDDGSAGASSRVSVTLAAGDVIVIVVDGYSAGSGDFQINIHLETPEVCGNGLDDDRDGDADCADYECDGLDLCIETGPVECFDGLDNDGDLDVDCADFDCRSEPDCVESGPAECHDGIDNDGDLDADCADYDCDADCTEPGMCGDGFDNDMDGLADCLDDECTCDPLCTGAAVVCPDQDLGSTVGSAVALGVIAPSTCSQRSGATCGSGGAGPELEFLWTAPATGTYVITTEDTTGMGMTYDTMLYVLDGSCSGPELVCNDDSAFGLLSSVTVTVTAGQQLLIVLDAYGAGGSGNYTLNINPM